MNMDQIITRAADEYAVTIPDTWEYAPAKSTLAIFRIVGGVGAINLSSFVKTPAAPSDASSLLAGLLPAVFFSTT